MCFYVGLKSDCNWTTTRASFSRFQASSRTTWSHTSTGELILHYAESVGDPTNLMQLYFWMLDIAYRLLDKIHLNFENWTEHFAIVEQFCTAYGCSGNAWKVLRILKLTLNSHFYFHWQVVAGALLGCIVALLLHAIWSESYS